MNIVILGAAESGVGAALLAQAKGHAVFVSDRGAIQPAYKDKLTKAGIEFEENQHSLDRILQADEVIKSPGIPEKAAVIKALREQKTPIISEIEFASRYTKARFIAITGTNGKTTTTLLTYHLLKEAGLSVGLAGNVGYSLAEQVVEDKFEYYVLELSSFQLDDIDRFQPWIAVLLNITPDHLDRYDYSLEAYARAKLNIVRNQDSDGTFIYNADDENIQRYFKAALRSVHQMPFSLHHRTDFQLAGYYTGQTEICLDLLPGYYSPTELITTAHSPLIGEHNRQNVLAAILVARVAGVEKARIEQALGSFHNADHRLQLVAEINGVEYINDSKATNVEAAWYALDGVKRPIVWIAGGTDKGNGLRPLAAPGRAKSESPRVPRGGQCQAARRVRNPGAAPRRNPKHGRRRAARRRPGRPRRRGAALALLRQLRPVQKLRRPRPPVHGRRAGIITKSSVIASLRSKLSLPLGLLI